MKTFVTFLFMALISVSLLTGCSDSDSSKNYTENVSDLNMKMIHISSGTFWMGSPETDSDAYVDERPQHQVELDFQS